jgi:hypothetical protein
MTAVPSPHLARVAAVRDAMTAAGFEPVAIYSPGAQMMTAQGPRPATGKEPVGRGWQRAPTIGPPARNQANTGMLCRGLRVIDLDVEDAETVAELVLLAMEHLGEAPLRYRDTSARVALVYAAAEGAPRKRVIVGTAGKVEALGEGQQLVVDGAHASGAALRWRPAPPWAAPRAELPAITEDALSGFLAAAAPIIGSTGEALAGAGMAAGADSRDDAELVRAIVTGDNFHDSLVALAARLIGRHVPPDSAREILLGLMLSHPENARDGRWKARVAGIPSIVTSAAAKFAGSAEARKAIAAQAGRRLRDGVDFADVMAEARADAAARGICPDSAARVVRWCAKQELARRASRHG